jgi:hypothetical protein
MTDKNMLTDTDYPLLHTDLETLSSSMLETLPLTDPHGS